MAIFIRIKVNFTGLCSLWVDLTGRVSLFWYHSWNLLLEQLIDYCDISLFSLQHLILSKCMFKVSKHNEHLPAFWHAADIKFTMTVYLQISMKFASLDIKFLARKILAHEKLLLFNVRYISELKQDNIYAGPSSTANCSLREFIPYIYFLCSPQGQQSNSIESEIWQAWQQIWTDKTSRLYPSGYSVPWLETLFKPHSVLCQNP